MDETLIQNWNLAVSPNDDIWHLGDFNFRSEQIGKGTYDYVKRLHGRIHIIWGNHDDTYAKKQWRAQVAAGAPRLFHSAQEVKYLKLHDEKITLYHYAQRVWRNSHHGAWHLFGHSHGSLPRLHRSMDVGVDAQNFVPIEFEEIKAYMVMQPVTNHHPELLLDPWNKEPSRPEEDDDHE